MLAAKPAKILLHFAYPVQVLDFSLLIHVQPLVLLELMAIPQPHEHVDLVIIIVHYVQVLCLLNVKLVLILGEHNIF